MLVRDILERPSSSSASTAPTPPHPPSTSRSTGFPVPQHRSKRPPSAFARSRQQPSSPTSTNASHAGRLVDAVPKLGESSSSSSFPPTEADMIRKEVDEENARRVAEMDEEERDREVTELKERFGEGLEGLMRKRKEARELAPEGGGQVRQVLDEVDEENRGKVSRMSEEERREELKELEERFGGTVLDGLRKRAEARLGKGKEPDCTVVPRRVSTRPDVVDNGRGPSRPAVRFADPPSPSAMKEQYFPTVPSEPSKLEWMQAIARPSADASPRFDLSGRPLSSAQMRDIPSSAGLHHHGASPDLAGYTLDEILLLCRSSVVNQRVTMLGVLAKVISRYRVDGESWPAEVREACEKEEIRKKGLDLGVEIVSSSARSLGVLRAGIDLLFQALGEPSFATISGERPFDPEPLLEQVPFGDLQDRMSDLFDMADALPLRTTQQLLLILRRAAHDSPATAEAVLPTASIAVRHLIFRKSQVEASRSPLTIEILELLHDIVASSRAAAQVAMEGGLVEPLTMFVAAISWKDAGNNMAFSDLRMALGAQVLRTWTALGRYGLGAGMAKSSADVLRVVASTVASIAGQPERSPEQTALVEAYLDLLTVWTVCAIDPHTTTPEHDLTWAQAEAFGWRDEAVAILQAESGRTTADISVIRAALDYLGAWVEGVKINEMAGGESQVKQLGEELPSQEIKSLTDRYSRDEQPVELFVMSAVRLHRLVSSASSTCGIFDHTIIDTLLARSLRVKGATSRLQAELLLLGASNEDPDLSKERARVALRLMSTLGPGEEPLALDICDFLLRADWVRLVPALQDAVAAITHPDSAVLLRPLLQYHILPDLTRITAPTTPSHLYLRATFTLRPFPSGSSVAKHLPGLPLNADWLFTPLDELLHSGDSEALKQTTPDWDASEMDIVRATLVLVRAQLALLPDSIPRASLILGMMKVYMLEHEQHTASSSDGVEVFRDTAVAESLDALMQSLLKSPQPASFSSNLDLENAALASLGPEHSFYQFYADFTALYESTSFGDRTFGQLLLAPLSMSYPADYRKLLWAEHPGVLRSLRLSAHQVPLLEEAKGIRGWFEPAESDADVLAGYVRALVRGWANGFLLDVAVHHLGCLFWRASGAAGKGDEKAWKEVRKSLMMAVLSQAPGEAVKRIWSVDVDRPGEGHAVERPEEEARTKIVAEVCGERGVARLQKID